MCQSGFCIFFLQYHKGNTCFLQGVAMLSRSGIPYWPQTAHSLPLVALFKCSMWMTPLQQGKGCAWGLLSAEPPPQALGCLLGGCSLIPSGAAGGTWSLAPWWKKEISVLPQRTWENTVHLRRKSSLFAWRRMPLLSSCILGIYSPCTLQRPLRPSQCHCCYWEFNVGKYEPHVVFLEHEVYLLVCKY